MLWGAGRYRKFYDDRNDYCDRGLGFLILSYARPAAPETGAGLS